MPGKEQYISDALSRNPLPLNSDIDRELGDEVQAHIDAVAATWPASATRKCEISAETEIDVELKTVRNYIENGWPAYASSISPELKPYYDARNELSIVDGFITYVDRIVIPKNLRADVMNKLHESHQGLTKCLVNAQAAVWWPGMTSQLSDIVNKCATCALRRPAQRSEPLMPSPLPERPWKVIAIDQLEFNNKQYLAVIDKYSRWIELKQINPPTARTVIQRLKEIFSVHGIPETVQSDNGPQFTSMEYKDFAKSWGFEVTTSSPYFPQANGAAERCVQTCKKILSQSDPLLALLNYRNTPHSATGISPSSALMGRRLRTRVPVLDKLLVPHAPNDSQMRSNDTAAKVDYKMQFDRRRGARTLPPLDVGQSVLLRTEGEKRWNKPGIVQESDTQNRTYLVKTPRGVVRRNRKHIQRVPFRHEAFSESVDDDDVGDNVERDNRDEGTVNVDNDPKPLWRSTRMKRKPVRLIEQM